MMNVAVIAEDRKFLNFFTYEATHAPFHFIWTTQIEEVWELLEKEKPEFLFFVVKEFNILEDWLGQLAENTAVSNVLCFVPELNMDERQVLWAAGVADIIELPMHQKELSYILKSLIGDRHSADQNMMHGSLQDFNLVNLMQLFEDGEKNGILRLEKNGVQGHVAFNRGKVVNAKVDKRDPIASIEVMNTWNTGRFQLELDKHRHPQKIKLDNRQIIFECMQQTNKLLKLMAKLPAKNVQLFTTPEFNYEEIGPALRQTIKDFKDGNTLENILTLYNENPMVMLEHMIKWIENSWLVERESYDTRIKAITEEENLSGIKKVMRTVFTKPRQRSEKKNAKMVSKDALRFSESHYKKSHLFSNKVLSNSFLNELGA